MVGSTMATQAVEITQSGENANREPSLQFNCFTTKLAPSYGNELNSEAYRKIDHDLQVMIAATVQSLNNPSHGILTWEALSEQMEQNQLLNDVENEQYSTGSLIEDNRGAQELDTSKGMYTSLVNLVKDSDIVDATPINADSLVRLVATAREKAAVSSTAGRLSNTAGIDVGILRYPDITNPYYKVYCIKIDVWFNAEKGAPAKSGVTCEYRRRDFKPRPDAIQETGAQAQAIAVADAEALFD